MKNVIDVRDMHTAIHGLYLVNKKPERMIKIFEFLENSGRWFVIQINDQVKAFRTLKTCQNNATKAQLTKIEVWEVV